MPTKADFEEAAAKFRAAAAQVSELTTAAEQAGAADIVRGGSLGREVPERILACAATAASCAGDILAVEAICMERAGIIESYEAELRIYDARHAAYRSALGAWQRDYDTWYFTGGATPYPGPAPGPPPKPVPPPAWADVRRV